MATEPIHHLHIEEFFTEEDFAEIVSAPEVDRTRAISDENLFERLLGAGYKIINVPGSITDRGQYLHWRKDGQRARTAEDGRSGGFGVTEAPDGDPAKASGFPGWQSRDVDRCWVPLGLVRNGDAANGQHFHRDILAVPRHHSRGESAVPSSAWAADAIAWQSVVHGNQRRIDEDDMASDGPAPWSRRTACGHRGPGRGGKVAFARADQEAPENHAAAIEGRRGAKEAVGPACWSPPVGLGPGRSGDRHRSTFGSPARRNDQARFPMPGRSPRPKGSPATDAR
jgi:hypothetical protein